MYKLEIFYHYYHLLLNKNILLPLILCIFLIILFILLKISIKFTVEITNFFFTYILAIINISFYCIFFFYLRILQINSSTNLKIIFNKLSNTFININNLSLYFQILSYLGLIILIFVWILIFIKLRKLLNYKLCQLYFYYHNIHQINNSKISKIFDKICSHFNLKYSFYKFHRFITSILNIKNTQNLSLILKLIPLVFSLIIIILECYFNNFTLYYIFYWLPIYMLILIWVQISEIIFCIWWLYKSYFN